MKSDEIEKNYEIQNFKYFIVSRDSRTPNSKYHRFGPFLGISVPFCHSPPEICILEYITQKQTILIKYTVES